MVANSLYHPAVTRHRNCHETAGDTYGTALVRFSKYTHTT
jgi:hypothetical protein